MKTDRELLELAAKAAGYQIHIWGTPGRESCARMDGDISNRWNPINDNGDALCLAVQLGITIAPGDVMCAASAPGAETHQAELVDGDIYAATRRAIVRAAAAIGEQMK